jgi:transposase
MSGFPLASAEIFKSGERKSLIMPDREVKTVSAWFEQHPTVEIVSRDRSSEYAAAIKKGAPQALQVADLWHLGKNLADLSTRAYQLVKYKKDYDQAAKS